MKYVSELKAESATGMYVVTRLAIRPRLDTWLRA